MKSQIENEKTEGWTWIRNSPKWHYFVDKLSLCRKFMLLQQPNDFEQGNNDSPDNCALCRKKLAKLNGKA